MGRTVHKARLVPDTAPDGLTEKVVLVRDLGIPIEIALGRWEAAAQHDIEDFMDRALMELEQRRVIDEDH